MRNELLDGRWGDSRSATSGPWAVGEMFPRVAIDDRVVAPASGAQIVRARVVFECPSEARFAAKTALAALLRANAAPGYVCETDLLTRASEFTDAAPDVSVYPAGVSPDTEGRFLEELAFEVHDGEPASHVILRVTDLVRVGVRRVFCVRLDQRRVYEWSRAAEQWWALDSDGAIEDSCLTAPLGVRATVDYLRRSSTE